jgi:hypothetical protein
MAIEDVAAAMMTAACLGVVARARARVNLRSRLLLSAMAVTSAAVACRRDASDSPFPTRAKAAKVCLQAAPNVDGKRPDQR